MDSKELLLDSLDKRGARYEEKLKDCRDNFSQDAVHDLRTSIRRLLAMLDVAAFVTSASRVKKLSYRIKEQLDGFSDLRDIHMLLSRVSDTIAAVPEVGPFQSYLERREKRRQRATKKHVKDLKLGGIRKRLLKIRKAIENLAPEELDNKLPQAVDESYLTVLQRYGEIDAAQLASVHELRVAFKKFRYMVEATHPCLPDFPESQLDKMRDYQTQMGDIQDLQVLLKTLAKFAAGRDSPTPEPVRRYYDQAQAKALAAFLENKGEVKSFWRATPLTSFPWQAAQPPKEE